MEKNYHRYIDHEYSYSLHLLNLDSVLRDLHAKLAPSFHHHEDWTAYYRFVLSTVPMMAYLKKGEQLGFYLSSTDKLDHYKLEINASGVFRTMMLKQSINQDISGVLRLVKFYPFTTIAPYETFLEFQNASLYKIASQVLKQSYQIDSEFIFYDKDNSYRSLLISKLPCTGKEKENLSIPDYLESRKKTLDSLLRSNDISKQDNNIYLVFSGEAKFECHCSRPILIEKMAPLYGQLFETSEDSDSIEIKCDYCQTSYLLNKEELYYASINLSSNKH